MHPRAQVSWSLAIGLWLGGCGAETPDSTTSSANPASTDRATTPAPTSTSPTPGAANPVTPITPPDDIALPLGSDDAGSKPAQECQRDIYEAKRVEVNLLMLVDLSGSMLSKVDSESLITQWEAVRTAMRTFISSPEADGLGVSLTYYPLLDERVACEQGAVCDDGGGCVYAVCELLQILDYPIPCANNADCPLEVPLDDGTILKDRCVLPFSCKDHPLQFCLIDDNCPNGDTCDVEAGSIGACPGANSCAIADYATPAVPLQVLPAGRQAMLDSLDERYVDFYSSTPTQIALQGAFAQVEEWQTAEPDKRSVVVLATDGIPEGCETILDPDASRATMNTIRTGASRGASTFVIGVLPEEDETIDGLAEQIAAQTASLEEMATAGGTTQPFLVRANVNTSQAFLEALDQIRTVALPCDYELPETTSNFDLVNVEVTTSGTAKTLPKVDNLAACDDGGWYYDADETSANDTPTRVVLCPSSCDAAKTSSAERVDVVLGCPTIRQIR